ncbi:uncharacterized protein LOC100906726, partial [Galendromus occidentalis]|uniref:Uncharacterized protein LOC100906726 n=1 Tax=Galendromus occidentalis TaxID=34638 RepID=A0AAJ6VW77_9ACAR
MIIDSQLGKGAWAEAVCFGTFCLNVTKFIEPLDKTPFEIITGHRPYLGRVLRFGTRYWFYNIQPGKDKLDKRAIAGAVVGIDEDGLSYRVLELGTTRVHRIRDIEVKDLAPLHEDENLLPPIPEDSATNDINGPPADDEEEEEELSPNGADDQGMPEDDDDWSGERNVDDDLGISSVNGT